MASSTTIKLITISWITKGDSEENLFNKFICYWISFNCFYNNYTGKTIDREALNDLKNRRKILSTYEVITTVPKNLELLKELQNICPLRSVKNNSIKNIDDTNSFAQVVDVIYQIRCNLFHGGKEETNERDIQVVTAATPVLELLVKRITSDHIS